MKVQVAVENRPKFEKTMNKWGAMIQCLGWDVLAKLYVDRLPPFQDVPKLDGPRRKRLKRAKIIILSSVMADLKENGMEIIEP